MQHELVWGNLVALIGEDDAIASERSNKSRANFILCFNLRRTLSCLAAPFLWTPPRPLTFAFGVGVACGSPEVARARRVHGDETGRRVSVCLPLSKQVDHQHLVANIK